MEIKGHTIRTDDEVWAWLNGLAGQSLNDKLRGLMTRPATTEPAPASGLQAATLNRIEEKIDQLLELGISVPEYAAPGQDFAPASIPGVQIGAGNLRPRRETGTERAQREARERQDRVAALDPVSDPSIDRSDEYVST